MVSGMSDSDDYLSDFLMVKNIFSSPFLWSSSLKYLINVFFFLVRRSFCNCLTDPIIINLFIILNTPIIQLTLPLIIIGLLRLRRIRRSHFYHFLRGICIANLVSLSTILIDIVGPSFFSNMKGESAQQYSIRPVLQALSVTFRAVLLRLHMAFKLRGGGGRNDELYKRKLRKGTVLNFTFCIRQLLW